VVLASVVPTMSTSCDTCGWLAAFGGMLAFGSFGVPIKSKVAQTLDIDPLAMQTYKTSMCFLTSWLVLLYGTLKIFGIKIHANVSDNSQIVSRNDYLYRRRIIVYSLGVRKFSP
jgi:hypothetical protein